MLVYDPKTWQRHGGKHKQGQRGLIVTAGMDVGGSGWWFCSTRGVGAIWRVSIRKEHILRGKERGKG